VGAGDSGDEQEYKRKGKVEEEVRGTFHSNKALLFSFPFSFVSHD